MLMDKTERALIDICEQLKEINRTLNKVVKVEAALSQGIMQYILADLKIRTHAYGGTDDDELDQLLEQLLKEDENERE